MHYITNVEAEIFSGGQEGADPGDGLGDTARVRAMFYNPMQLPGMLEQSSCGGHYLHELVRTTDGWRSRHLREVNVWFINRPGPDTPD